MNGLTWLLVGFLWVGNAFAASWKVDALKDLRARYGLTAFDNIDGFPERLQRVKVAIIDNGFGDQSALVEDLPNTLFKTVLQYPEEFLKRHPRLQGDQIELEDTKHGREMATIAWGITGGSRSDAPQFYLLNGRGLTSLDRAVQYAIDEKVDIILYSQNWEYGGNFDGRGFINAMVTRATEKGILWVNAAGNYGARVFNAPVKYEAGKREAGPDTWLDLNGKKELRVLSRLDDNPVRIVLSWNRNGEDRKAGTDADLDLFLYDEYGSLVASSEKAQKLGTPDLNVDEDNGETLARELITKSLSRNRVGHYTLRVKAKAGRFNGTDKLRIAVIPKRPPIYEGKEGRMVDPVEFVDATQDHEIMIPADHPDVLSIGDLTRLSSRGPTTDGRQKPDLYMATSQVEFTSGVTTGGTSNAAAMFAGVAAMLKAFRPEITRDEILTFVKKQYPSQVQRGEARGVADLGIDLVREKHPIVFQAINARIRNGLGDNGSPIVLAGRYRRDGCYVVALDRSPADLAAWWSNIPTDSREIDNVEVYLRTQEKLTPAGLATGRLEAHSYVRSRLRGEGYQAEAWERELDESPENFVQVIQARRLQTDPKEKTLPLWTTPTPAQLRALKK